jgi:hypothetical protein
MVDQRDEFYVGYMASMPAGHARRVRGGVVGLGVLGLVAAGLAAGSLRDPGDAVWGNEVARHAGVVVCEPYPVLMMPPAAGRGGYGAAWRGAVLVEEGKIGAGARCAGATGKGVEIAGTELRRGGGLMLEIGAAEGSFKVGGAPAEPPAASDLGPLTLEGEVVDLKCFLGAMKPGDGKTHKACAIRCVSGGVPPALAVFGSGGEATCYLLAGPGGEAINGELLPFVGERVRVAGRGSERGGARTLRIDWATLRRL